MTIYLIRHGETEFNRQGIVQGSGVDTSLNEKGLAQAAAFFRTYQHLDFELVVTSGLQRTHQTVQSFLDGGIAWVKETDINEISWGEHEGLPGSPERIAMYENMIGAWQSGNPDVSLPGGETARQLADRVGRFVEWLKIRPEQRILVCSHGRTIRCLVTLLKGRPLADMEMVTHSNTGCFKIRLVDGQFVFDAENDMGHL